jgi:hypothetical protein
MSANDQPGYEDEDKDRKNREREDEDRFRDKDRDREEREYKEKRELEDYPPIEVRRDKLKIKNYECAYCTSTTHQAKHREDPEQNFPFCNDMHPLLFCRRYWQQKAADGREADDDDL